MWATGGAHRSNLLLKSGTLKDEPFKYWGGLKSLEDEVGIGRPQHIKDLDGSRAAWLWRHWRLGDRAALVKLVEYNLYDTVNLRALAAIGFNRMVQKSGFTHAPLPVSHRGDVLYDVSRLLSL